MAENPISELKDKILGMTEAQRKVADYIVKNPLEVAFMTIDQLAGIVGTSTNTIMRLMSYLDYSGYSEFQKEIQELFKKSVNPKVKLEVNLKKTSPSNLWTQCLERQKKNIDESFSRISSEILDETLQRIIDAKQVYFVTARGGLSVAEYLNGFFNRIFGKCRLIWADNMIEWVDLLPGMDSSTLIIAISYPRYASRLLNLLKLARANDTQIISITDSYSSPLVEFSDFIIPCSCDSLGFHNSPVSAMVIADCLISVVALRHPKLVSERLDRSNKIVSALDYYTL